MATAEHHKAHHGSNALGGTHVKQYENLKTLLKNAKSTNGQDLYAHLQEVFKKLILHYPDQALDKLEEVSFLVKHNGSGYKINDYLVLEERKEYDQLSASQKQYLEKLVTFFRKPPAENEEEEGAGASDEPPAATGNVSDLMNDSKIFEWAGIGFGEVESYRILKSLKKLALDTGAGNIRFFGKIHGTQSDYYIAEGQEGTEDEGEKPEDFEARGTGVNKFVYWVTNNVFDKWVKLPDLLPKDIRAARQVKVLFTGNLDRLIYTNPYFFGQEKHYLRAQIARIYHSTNVVPASLYKVSEDPKEIEDATPEGDETEVRIPSTHDMAQSKSWAHYSQSILNAGRITHMQPPVPADAKDGEDEEYFMKKLEESDPTEKRLKLISQDSPVNVAGNAKHPAWIVKLMGDKNVYQHQTNPKKTVNYGVVVVRSLQWPGSFTFYSQGRYLSIYVGNGLKYETQSYYPVHPPMILDDPGNEWIEQPEPTPLFEEVVVQQEENPDGGNAEQEEY